VDAYIRVSDLGGREEEESTEVYEAQCREWANRNGVEIDEVVDDTDVSGSVAVSERGLERLIERVESGESDGIVTPYLDRFGRDLIEGAVALKKISDAGGKLVAVRDGFDSTSPGSELVFNLRMAIAQDYLQRVKENFQAATDRAVKRGVWIPPRVPFGYRKDDRRALVIDETEAGIVRELFRRRSEGVNVMQLRDWLNGEHAEVIRANRERNRRDEKKREHRETISRGGVRSMLDNRAYVGEMRVASKGKGEPRVVKNACPPILTEAEWEAGQVKHDFVPRTGKAEDAELRGLVYCETCGTRCKVGASGPRGNRKTHYICNSDTCDKHAAISTAKLDSHAEAILMYASTNGDPHVEAIILGDTRYEDALAAVETAKADLEDFASNIEVQRTLGIEGFAAALKTRKVALKAARRHFSQIQQSTSPSTRLKGEPPKTRAGVEAALVAERNATYIAKVVIRPSGRGKWQPASERAEVFWHGATEPAPLPPAFDPQAPGAAPSHIAVAA
jgi:DNA invertase Pin-like site-specific DNA recombinase